MGKRLPETLVIKQPLYFALDLAPQPLHVPSFWHFQTIVLDVCFFSVDIALSSSQGS
jgi:hypothetical protein